MNAWTSPPATNVFKQEENARSGLGWQTLLCRLVLIRKPLRRHRFNIFKQRHAGLHLAHAEGSIELLLAD
jgi:hypothetical protein